MCTNDLIKLEEEKNKREHSNGLDKHYKFGKLSNQKKITH